MPAYHHQEPSQYNGGNLQHGAVYDPSQYGGFNSQPTRDTFEPSGYQVPEPEPYSDEPSYPLPQAQSTEPLGPSSKEDFPEEFTPSSRRPGSARNVRAWRYQQGRRLWTQGSRPRCICRFFFCTVLITIFLVVCIVLPLALWIQPPNIIIGGGNSTSPVVIQNVNTVQDGIQVNLGLPIEIVNPNYFSVKITHINADIIYPINSTSIGGGSIPSVNLASHAITEFTFPFKLSYTTSIDPSFAILRDFASKCLPSPQQNLSVKYKINVGVRVFFITISPTISNSIVFQCPFSSNDITNLAKEVGLDLKSIASS